MIGVILLHSATFPSPILLFLWLLLHASRGISTNIFHALMNKEAPRFTWWRVGWRPFLVLPILITTRVQLLYLSNWYFLEKENKNVEPSFKLALALRYWYFLCSLVVTRLIFCSSCIFRVVLFSLFNFPCLVFYLFIYDCYYF